MDQEGNNFEKKKNNWPDSVTSNTLKLSITMKHIAFRDKENSFGECACDLCSFSSVYNFG